MKLLGPFGAGPAQVRCELAGPAAVAVPVVPGTPKGGVGTATLVNARIPVRELIAARPGKPSRWRPGLAVDIARRTYELPVAAADAGPVPQQRLWHRRRPYRVSVLADEEGLLELAVAPIKPLRVITQRLRLPRKK
jgi:hypothetical protein